MSRKHPRYARKRRNPPGTAPGTLKPDPEAARGRVHAMRLSAAGLEEDDTAEILPPAEGEILWLNVDGLGDAELLSRIGQVFGLHPLAVEDVVNDHQRPKAEDYGTQTFIVLQMPMADADGAFRTEQVSIFLGERYVITVQEEPGDVFNPVRTRIRNPQGMIRQRGADYLCYALIDAVIDAYFPVLEALGERLEAMEDRVVLESGEVAMSEVHHLKRSLMSMRAGIWPLRDLIAALLREETPRFSAMTKLYLRDCHDHVVQLIEMVQTYREISTSLVELILSQQANRTNEVMRVLTLIATIFIPLTFVVGVYGMNFTDMPELHWRFGYPGVMLLMAAIAVALVIWFRRKGWLGRNDP